MLKKKQDWKLLSNKEIEERCSHQSMIYNDNLYVFSGFNEKNGPANFHNLAGTHVFNLHSHRWSDQYFQDFIPHSHYCSVVYKDKWYIFGGTISAPPTLGLNPLYGELASNSLFLLNLSHGSQWNNMHLSHAPPARFKHSGVLIGNEMIMFGGMDPDNDTMFDDVWSLNLDQMVWKRLKTINDKNCPIQSRASHCACSVNGVMYVYGGKNLQTNERFNTLYQLKDLQWKMLEAKGDIPRPRAGATLEGYKNYLYLFGGFTGKSDVNDFYRYDLEVMTWKKLECGKVPQPRSFHTAHIHCDRGAKLILFGGLFQDFEQDQTVDNDHDFLDWSKEDYHSDVSQFDLESEVFYEELLRSCQKSRFCDILFVTCN